MSEHLEYHRRITREWKLRHPEETKKQKERYREKHREDIKRCNKKYALELKTTVLTHYGGNPFKCACCGETEIKFLTIDHIHNDGGEHRRRINSRGGKGFYILLIKNNFPEGYQVLCWNCNMGKAHNNGICPHKSLSEGRMES